MENFKIRYYRECTDLRTIYENYCLIAGRTVAYYLSGASPYLTLEDFSNLLRKENEQTYCPFIVVSLEDHPIGIARTSKLDRRCRHYHVSVYLWENVGRTEAVLRRILDTVLSGTANMVICQIPGYQTEFLTAARNVGMIQAGCIPDYIFYKSVDGAPDIWPEYTFIMKMQEWAVQKESGDCYDL